ncbi:MAG: peptidase M48 [Rhodospirillales bacterium CG15_BIG_FIL_POST_REV_8_21_14_020_66_15]|nr:MAG: peptidase M48 [Rhodospirillales bacterium CG15_BIG_FIL_POST_REV_8_21_14_020_66_15]
MRRFLTALALLAPLLFGAACTTNPATGEQSFTAFMSEQDELRVGAEEHPKILKDMGGEYMDPTIQTYVDWVGEKLAKVSDLPGLKFKFTVLNDPEINAFALPGGYVYITRGLIALAENEAEMAGVLAHEIGHVTARHTAQRYSAAMATNLGLLGASVLGSVFGVPADLNRVAGQIGQLYLQAYSRDQELEADMLAVRYLTRAGYDSRTLETFFRKMRQHTSITQRVRGRPDEDPAGNIMSTHPRTSDRIAQAIQLARVPPNANPRVGREDYLARIDGMLWGDSPDQGVVHGRVFEHPELRFRFEVPPGFYLINSPRQVAAHGPDRTIILFNQLNQKEAQRVGAMRSYVSSWGGGRLGGVERIDVNGLEAATGSARIDTSEGVRDVRLVAIRFARDRVYRFLFLTPPEATARRGEDLRRVTYSFRRLTEAEAKAVKTLKLRVRTVTPGDTPDKLANLMPLESFRLDWFMALNGLTQGDRLTPGTKVKVVTP